MNKPIALLAVLAFCASASAYGPMSESVIRSDNNPPAEKEKEPAPKRSSDWMRSSVLYEVSLRSFSPEGKFFRLEERLMTLKNFGFGAIVLSPVFPIGELNRQGAMGSPFSVRDHAQVNLELGTKEGLKRLISEARSNNLKVVLSWVAASTAWDHPWIKAHPEWYKKTEAGEIAPAGDERKDAAALNYENEDLRKEMTELMSAWARDYDVDGFKVVDAHQVPDDFWLEARASLRKASPGIVLLPLADPQGSAVNAFDLLPARAFHRALRDAAQGKAKASDVVAVLKEEEADRRLRLRFCEEPFSLRSAQALGPANLAGALLTLTLPGVPQIVAGQEIGETGHESLAERTPIDWKAGRRESPEVQKFYKKLLAFRQAHPSLLRGQAYYLKSADDARIIAYACSYRGDAVLVAVNLSGEPFEGALDVPEIFRDNKNRVAAKPLFPSGTLSANSSLTLPAWGFQVWIPK